MGGGVGSAGKEAAGHIRKIQRTGPALRNAFRRIDSVCHFTGTLLWILGAVLLVPTGVAILFWGERGDGWSTVVAFVLPAVGCGLFGLLLRTVCRPGTPDMPGAILICAVGWLAAAAVGAVPFVLAIGSGYLDACFEAMSGFTTTGITVFSGLDFMPRSVLFWRSLTQWLGGTGILSFFLVVLFHGAGAHHLLGAESHKISSTRPVPGLFGTLRVLWTIYAGFTLVFVGVLTLEGMPAFDAVCHALTALSTGGFSPYDSSIAYYAAANYPRYRLIEYTLTLAMLLGGMSFLVHYRVLTRDFRALWDGIEIRYWWGLVGGGTLLVMIDSLRSGGAFTLPAIERSFRLALFQVVSILTTTGFGTQDIASGFFPACSRLLFICMMVIGGCVGSTGGGIKVLRIAILGRLMAREVLRLRVPRRASTRLVIDGKIVPDDEIHRVCALFFAWIALLMVGGGITALFSSQGPWESFSGMCSALGNIGPCYISVADMIRIHPVVKVTYMLGMLAGRLEILPILLLFSRKAWV